MRVDPHARRRQDSVVVRAGLSKTLTNAELVAAFARAQQGKLHPKTIEGYVSFVADAMAYARGEASAELHVSKWTRETLWEYIHYVEGNYCRSFRAVNAPWASGASCRKRVWIGLQPVETALSETCATCPRFESSPTGIQERLKALNRFWKFLTRSGVASANFVRDVASEYAADLRRDARRERRRNPSVEEMVELVNETLNPRNRAFYACSAKWWFRPNEMMMLDRYASFPEFDRGGDLVVLPESKGALDKRKGNRVSVIDSELRPIIEQYFLWWERTVERTDDGSPAHTSMWLTMRGRPLEFDSNFYAALFYPDCLRLGLMTEDDKRDPLRRWTAHCQRHFGEKLLMMNNCPDTWSKHFRGDVVKDARGHYFVPTPEQIREKYLEWVPKLGLAPLPQMQAASVIYAPDRERAAHRAIFQKGIDRALAWKRPTEPFRCQAIVRVGARGEILEQVALVPRRYVPSYLFAVRNARPAERFEARPDVDAPKYGRNFHSSKIIRLFKEAQAWLDV